ncbi:uncharacterized protein LOC124175404 [Neodiprion fabricii]|uniref:uncharacterized protein LOC124175404 n=1 Tax=Neodiprion fabricii TaxID=2872261 RepID=UPI001ED8F630|nr:uncharacterized protein LOC124175404 [Neodiprion fabricii]
MALIVKKYITLRPPNALSKTFFFGHKNGKCTVQVIGKHTFEKIPEQIAEFLGLEGPERCIGHIFRSTTVLVDSQANMETLKRHREWKSSTVAKGYIADSIRHKRNTGSMIDNINKSSMSKTAFVIPTSTVSKAPDSTNSQPLKKAKFSDSMISNMINLPTMTLTLAKAPD